MGQKVHPKSVRLGYTADWDSRWFNLRQMPELLEEDQQIRRYIKAKLAQAAISRILIERTGKFLQVNLFTARPGIVIGRGGQEIEKLRADIEDISGCQTRINVLDIKRPELEAQLIAEGVALQLEKQASYRRVMKKAIERAMAAGALGIKIKISGRLGGAEIARSLWMKEGRIPLQTFRADINYGFAEAMTKMGQIGVKVWVFRKEHFAENIVAAKEVGEVQPVSPENLNEIKDKEIDLTVAPTEEEGKE
jgi:small subunit ribosomal protein S3